MAAEQQAPVSEAQIAVHWREEEYYYPPAAFIGQANAADPAILERFSEEHFPECFKEYADLLSWDAYWHTTLDTSNAPFWKWFVGGRLNASYNCVDRHLATSRDKAALIWVPEPEDENPRAITYQELYRQVNEFAALLRDFAAVKTGDRVTFHLPMVAELPVSMLACARLGVIHSEVFGGFRLLPQRPADRPQGEGRRGCGEGAGARRGGRQGARLATPPRPVRVREPDDPGAGLLR
jgi:acetyl-CoA synthetase